MNISKLCHILIIFFVILNVITSLEKLSKQPGAPFTEHSLLPKPVQIDYLTLFSPLYPYENALEYPWVNTNPDSPQYFLTRYKENLENHPRLFLASKRVSEILAYGDYMSEMTWLKLLYSYEGNIRDEIKNAYNIEDHQTKYALIQQIFTNISQHKKDLLGKEMNSLRQAKLRQLFSSLKSEIPSLFKEEEYVYYFPTTIIKDREIGLYEITVYRESDNWDDIVFSQLPLETKWKDDHLVFQGLIEDLKDTVLIKNPYHRNNQQKFTEEDINKLPIVSAKKLSQLVNASSSAHLNTREKNATLFLKNYTRKDTDLLLSEKNEGWEIVKYISNDSHTQILTFRYTIHDNAIKKLILILSIGLVYYVYITNRKFFWKKIKRIPSLKPFFKTKILQNTYIYLFIISSTLFLPLVFFTTTSILLTAYALTYFKRRKILYMSFIIILAMGIFHSLHLNLFSERLAYLIIYIIIGLLIIKVSNLKII